MTVILKLRYRSQKIEHKQQALNTHSAFKNFLYSVKPENRRHFSLINATRVIRTRAYDPNHEPI